MARAQQGNNFETWCRNNDCSYLLDEWDKAKNELGPSQYTKGSNKKVWWLCSKGHSYDMTVYDRSTQKLNCPYCGSQRVLEGYNDLGTTFPEIAKEWDYEKNAPLKPTEIMAKSNKKVWWLCSKGHSYQTKICHRTDGHGCPYCAGLKPAKGENDLKTLYPAICTEWDYEKNKLGPEEFLPSSNKKAWWICSKGHSWEAVISTRANRGYGCPTCSREKGTSFSEQAIYYYLKKAYPDTVSGDRSAVGLELDVYIPSLRIAIEYDGYRWHSSEKAYLRTVKKRKLCEDKGIELIRIKEQGLPELEFSEISPLEFTVITPSTDYGDQLINEYQGLGKSIFNLLCYLGDVTVDINIQRDRIEIMSGYIITEKENSLADEHPDIAAEWDSEKNKRLQPAYFTSSSNKKVWWKCINGHSYEASIAYRTRGRGCPYCVNRKTLEGVNTLDATDPELLKDWDYEKNSFSPSSVVRGSHIKINWKCSVCGHEWKSDLSSRAIGHRNCPSCARKRQALAQRKAVMNIDTGETYSCCREASEATGIPEASIRTCCSGKSRSAFGSHWKYVNS